MLGRALSAAAFCVVAFGATLLVQGIWSALLVANLQTTPAVPWSVPVMAGVLWALWSYAGGRWGPARTQAFRARSLRAGPLAWPILVRALAAGMLGLGALVLLWTIVFQLVAVPLVRADLSGYPLVTVIAVEAMASLVGAIVEEAGLRGYMLSRLRREMAGPLAIILVALVISPGHAATQGAALPVLLWYFVADVMFGTLAYIAGSIRPGIVVHAIGLFIFFALVWPADASRTVIPIDRADASFWLSVAACLTLSAASAALLIQLGRESKETACPPRPRDY